MKRGKDAGEKVIRTSRNLSEQLVARDPFEAFKAEKPTRNRKKSAKESTSIRDSQRASPLPPFVSCNHHVKERTATDRRALPLNNVHGVPAPPPLLPLLPDPDLLPYASPPTLSSSVRVTMRWRVMEVVFVGFSGQGKGGSSTVSGVVLDGGDDLRPFVKGGFRRMVSAEKESYRPS
jgi:hypothetical protein